MLRATTAEMALIRTALPNFVNFMRFLHPGQACAAKFASSTAELGWDGSLLHIVKARGLLCLVSTQDWAKEGTSSTTRLAKILDQRPAVGQERFRVRSRF